MRGQSHPCTHILVADGEPDPRVDDWDAQHIVITKNLGNYGDTPRAIGSMSAIGQDFDAIAYLDADNWFLPDHIAALVALRNETGAAVCTSQRNLHRLDGTFLSACWESGRDTFTDTNCLMLIGPARELSVAWAYVPAALHPIGDRIVWSWIAKSRWPRAHGDFRTVAYRTRYAHHYRALNESPPPGAKLAKDVRDAYNAALKMGFGTLGMTFTGPKRG